MSKAASPTAKRRDRQIALVAGIAGVQAVAAVFFAGIVAKRALFG